MSWRESRPLLALHAVVALAFGGCGGAEPVIESAEDADREIRFERSPGGVYEVAPAWVRANLRRVRVIDVREERELREDGHIEGVEWLPLGGLAVGAATWSREAPIVLVCRSGRRSARGVDVLDELGFHHVASMTGGMQAWRAEGFPLTQEPTYRPIHDEATASRARLGEGEEALDVHWVRVASLLFGGSQACVDGRDEHPVLGTPGGDAGELVLALATAESVTGRELSTAEVESVLRDYVRAFGRFYFHTDVHAMEQLAASLRADPRFASVLAEDPSVETLVRSPPQALEGPLLEALVHPEHVGCGHLRSMLRHPAAYHTRVALVQEVLVAAYRRLVRHPEDVELVVLEGSHREGSVMIVRLEGDVHPYSRVPAIAPRAGTTSRFVVHPQVSAFVREQNAYLLLEETTTLRDAGVSAESFVARLAELAAIQAETTLGLLAPDLPREELLFRGRTLSSRAPLAAD
ncbi:MAG: hypothetical protein KC619_16030 [Myxococcales bacterium]|nr:hypothetical protein [Myxococcales bacterium]